MASTYKRGIGKLKRWRDELPMNLSFLLSRLTGRAYWRVNVDDAEIHLGFDSALHHAIAKYESEGKLETEILECWLRIEAGVVYDVGGYNGLCGILYAKAHPESRVTIFEPDLINYHQILNNIALNQLSNCAAERVAILDKDGLVRFSQGGRSKEKIVEDGGSIVPALPLSHYPKADLIKIDVEGAEGKVLRGLSYSPPNIILELHSPEYLAHYGDTRKGVLEIGKALHLTPTLLSDRKSEQHYLLEAKQQD